ncbi:zinc-ribbon domain-containing protein [uncultured Chloroflexus sp.]|uniref:zinc-ribbon domain-containing protein n=1 Tax=uncultured Chloroflexus sp. TaxID=214040 RepID=UPI0026227E96|nr:zinc-ribbon domain-containing protein [uncultured Chloroflexus sp.]
MSEPQQPSFCPQCGHKLTANDRFCPECGARVPEKVAPPTTIIPPDQPAAPPTTIIPPDRPAAPPTPPVIPPTQSAGSPPDPFIPPPPSYRIPASSPPPHQIPSSVEMQATPPNNKLIWLLVGGIGLLLLIFIGACVFIVISLSSFSFSDVTNTPTPVTGEPSTSGGGAVESVIGGEIVFRDDFENPADSNLGTSEDSRARYAYEQGNYIIEVKEPELLVWALVDGSYRNVVIEASYSIPRNSPAGAAGLIFHYQDADNFYLFSVSNDGYYALELLEDNQWETIIDWTQHEAIKPGNNRMRVELRGDEITLYINDRRLEQTRDPTFTRGEVGLAVTSFDESGIIVRFDEITIRQR